MRILTEAEEGEIKNRLKQEASVYKRGWGAGRADYEEIRVFYWPFDKQEYRSRVEKLPELIEKLEHNKLYAVAFKQEQYGEFADNFEQKYENSSLEIQPEDVIELSQELVEFMVVPESLEWMIILDHEGDISFNGEKEFIQKVKNHFPDWEQLSQLSEQDFRYQPED